MCRKVSRLLRGWVSKALLILAGVSQFAACSPAAEERLFRSPEGAYSVRLTGTFRQTYNPFALARVRVSITKGDVVIAELADIFDADSFDTSFDAFYPRTFWVEPRTFRMTGATHNEALDEISVKNESGKVINGISVATTDTVVFVDMSPGLTLVSPVMSMSTGGNVFVRVKIQFGDGQRLEESLHLKPSVSKQQQNRVAITVFKDRLAIGLSMKERSPPLR